MQFAVAGVFHLYFGDASKHPIVGNYLRSVPDLPQQIVLTMVPASRLKRLWQLFRELIRVRRQSDWALQCHDVVSAFLGVIFWKGRVIYDSHEIYSSFANSTAAAKFIDWLERFAIRKATIVVFPSSYRSEYYDAQDCDVRIVENLYYPYDPDHQEEGVGSEPSVFVYTGLFTPARAIDDIVAAFGDSSLHDSRLILAGQRTAYLDSVLADASPNVEYIGEISHAEVADLLRTADAGFAIYRPVNENNRRCAPTKIFEFLYFGLRVIVSRSPYIMQIKDDFGGDQIVPLDDIDAASIIKACLEARKPKVAADSRTRERVCWQSQMSTILSLYE